MFRILSVMISLMLSIYFYIVYILRKHKEFNYFNISGDRDRVMLFQRILTNIHSEDEEEQGKMESITTNKLEGQEDHRDKIDYNKGRARNKF